MFFLAVLVLLLAKNTLYCTLIRQNHTLGKGNILQNTRNFPVLTTHFQSNICQVRPSNLIKLNILFYHYGNQLERLSSSGCCALTDNVSLLVITICLFFLLCLNDVQYVVIYGNSANKQ